MSKFKFEIIQGQERLNPEFIHDYLSNVAYWSKGRSIEVVQKSIENSICFGAYLESGVQIGFARVVSDRAVFAWLMDVFVIDEYKGRGVGKALMDTMFSYPDLIGLKRWGLCTLDAHVLYKKYGFRELENYEIHMERVQTK